jgi:2-polyprenyl-6-methoxyphenol hydroxylase-like FAD-dependent oxidoreductase
MVAEVVIAGAGPNGLMLACELSLAGVRPVVLERLPEPTERNRANGLVGRVLDDNPFYLLPVPQVRMEQVLAERAADLGVEVRRGHELTGLTQHADTVTVEVSGRRGHEEISCRYLVGADGAHSTTRKLAGIGFPGAVNEDIVTRIAEVAVPAELVDPATGGLNVPGYGYLAPMYHRTERGVFGYGRIPSRPDLVFTVEWTSDGIDTDAPPTLEEVHDSVYRVMGADLPLRHPEGRGRHRLDRSIGVHTRLADRYRDGRVLLVGDAAHVHFVIGGPGLNLGLQDAVNLGWKLAAVIRGWAPDGLLDTYDAERRPVGQRVSMHSQAQLALLAPRAEVTALRELFAEILRDQHAVAHVANLMAGAEVRYDPGVSETHRLVGRWAPDLLLETGTGPVRLAELTTTARPLVLDLTENGSLATVAYAWRDRVDTVTARIEDASTTGLLLRARTATSPGPPTPLVRSSASGSHCAPRSRPGSAHGPRSPGVEIDEVQAQDRCLVDHGLAVAATGDQASRSQRRAVLRRRRRADAEPAREVTGRVLGAQQSQPAARVTPRTAARESDSGPTRRLSLAGAG